MDSLVGWTLIICPSVEASTTKCIRTTFYLEHIVPNRVLDFIEISSNEPRKETNFVLGHVSVGRHQLSFS